MYYVLVDRTDPARLRAVKEYNYITDALRGMRLTNRARGWTRVTRGSTGGTYLEWARHADGRYDHAPCVVMFRPVYESAISSTAPAVV